MIWGIAFTAGVRDIEFIGYMNSLVHAILNTVISLLIVANYSERDIIQIHIATWNKPHFRLPLLLELFKFFGAFQTAFFIMDSIQLLLFYRDKPLSFRITFIVHHIFALCCCTCVYWLDPYIQYIYVYNTLVECSTIFLNLRYFGRQ